MLPDATKSAGLHERSQQPTDITKIQDSTRVKRPLLSIEKGECSQPLSSPSDSANLTSCSLARHLRSPGRGAISNPHEHTPLTNTTRQSPQEEQVSELLRPAYRTSVYQRKGPSIVLKASR